MSIYMCTLDILQYIAFIDAIFYETIYNDKRISLSPFHSRVLWACGG